MSPDSYTEYVATDFIETATGEPAGINEVQITLNVRNPTKEPICIYEGLVTFAEVVSARHTDRSMRSFQDDAWETDVRGIIGGGYGLGEVVHKEKGTKQKVGAFWPAIEITPGETYTLSQLRNYGQYTLLYGNATDGVGLETFPAKGPFILSFRGLQFFRCNKLNTSLRRKVNSQVFALDDRLKITEHTPDGLLWEFPVTSNQEKFEMKLRAPPAGWFQTIYD